MLVEDLIKCVENYPSANTISYEFSCTEKEASQILEEGVLANVLRVADEHVNWKLREYGKGDNIDTKVYQLWLDENYIHVNKKYYLNWQCPSCPTILHSEITPTRCSCGQRGGFVLISKPKEMSGEEQTTIYRQLARDFFIKQPYFYDENKIWWLWVINKWKMVDDVDIMNAFDSYFVQETERSDIKSRITEALKKYGRKKKPNEAKNSWVQFNNVIIDIETGEEIIPSPKYFVTNPVPWDLGESEETPNIDRLIKEWTGNEVDEITLKEIMAYSAYPHMKIHRIFCLIGKGRNGKDQFLKIMKKFVGTDNTTSLDIELINSRFETNSLFKKLLCLIGEIDSGVFRKTRGIKNILGDGTMRIEFKGKDKFDFVNYAKPIIATNRLPETTDKTDGFYSKWTTVKFPNQFPEGKDVFKSVTDEEYRNFARKTLRILKELFERGTFANDGSIENREKNYESFSNPMEEFIDKFCERDLSEKIVFADFYYKYLDYRTSNDYTNVSKIDVSKSLKEKKYEIKVGKYEDTTKSYIHGLKWRDELFI